MKKVFLNNSEKLVGSISTIISATFINNNPSVANNSALITSIAILIINDYISYGKTRDTNLKDWIRVNSLLHERTLKEQNLDRKNWGKTKHWI